MTLLLSTTCCPFRRAIGADHGGLQQQRKKAAHDHVGHARGSEQPRVWHALYKKPMLRTYLSLTSSITYPIVSVHAPELTYLSYLRLPFTLHHNDVLLLNINSGSFDCFPTHHYY